ncbi:MAG TPA: alpha/beta hydrolase [Gammaproteobacteria bacterium]|nr:alpha/beta hydrolase [Acidiferrobacteraceae bacterium]MDP6399565.1 alpha/beta hydrolase [Arenicellales bacterium]HCX88089.1 alpha/beta hydrolase [Gammaproteobacteria bacterium]MDP6552240.1 alpha/beta hydrolase [Arenicellales bacterium]MDP6790521.1 alpha/beta hydrolase [Arenicellales bacterium]
MSQHTDKIRIQGCALEFQWLGPSPSAQAPTLVFLHEGLGCVQMWRDFPQQLAAVTGLGALNYSRAGYGGSDAAVLPRRSDYMHDEAQKVLPQVLDTFGIKSAILVGHSDGGSIALIHAGSEVGTRIKAMILLAPHVFVEPLSVASISEAAELYRSTDLSERLARYHGDSVDQTFWGWNDIWLHTHFRQWNIEHYLPKITVPVLMLQGDKDQYGTLAQLRAIESGVRGPTQRQLFADCGHSVYRDQPDATLSACCAFLQSLAIRP